MKPIKPSDEKVPELGARARDLVKTYKLTDAQANQLNDLGVDEIDTTKTPADYRALHDWVSINFAKQLKVVGISIGRFLNDEEINKYNLEGGIDKKYLEYTLDSEVKLPNGMVLQPGKFVIDRDKAVRGTMEMRNTNNKGVGIKFSECSGDDYPMYYSRPDKDSKATAIPWDYTGGDTMTAIRDSWTKRKLGEDLSKIETIVIGMMRAKNLQSTVKEILREDERKRIMDLLNL